jgi:hypothetical protein
MIFKIFEFFGQIGSVDDILLLKTEPNIFIPVADPGGAIPNNIKAKDMICITAKTTVSAVLCIHIAK